MANYDVFILDGDSNSCYGTVDGTNGDPVIGAAGERIFCWTGSNTIVAGNDPLNFAGVGTAGNKNSIGVPFAKLWRDLGYLRADRNILLIPCAYAGTGFTSGHWQPGGAAHEATVAIVNAAMASGHDIVIQGMLFNGGANDAGVNTPNFSSLFQTKIADYRARITGFANAPIVMGNFVPEWKDQSGTRLHIWNAIVDMPNQIANLAYAPPDIPTYLTAHNPPAGIHFSSSAMAAYAQRQLDALLTLKRDLTVVLGSGGAPAGDFDLAWVSSAADSTPLFRAIGWPVLAQPGDTLRLTLNVTNYDVLLTAYEMADGRVNFPTGRLDNGAYVAQAALIKPGQTYLSNTVAVTILDDVPPVLSGVAGVPAQFDPSTASGSFTTDDNSGNVYWVVSASATRPSNAQIKLGQIHTGAAAVSSGAQEITAAGTHPFATAITGLAPSTTYYIHALHQDYAQNISTGMTSPGFTTIAPLTGAETLAGPEANGVFIDFRDGTMLIRDTLTPANNYSGPISGKLAITGSLPATAGTGPTFNASNFAELLSGFPLPVYNTGYTLYTWGEAPSGSGVFVALNDAAGLYSNASYIQNAGAALALRGYKDALGYLVYNGTFTADVAQKAALTVNNAGQTGGISIEGSYLANGLSVAAYPAFSNLQIGRMGGPGAAHLPNGKIRTVAYVPRLLTPAQMNSLTTTGRFT